MFTNLKLHNFQNHRNLEIPLSQITTIIGESDTGKSALVRAIQWVCLNSLQGDSFITHGKKKCYVSLNLSDYGDIVRRRGAGINGYVLDDGEERNAIGRDVPSDITKILNIGEINIAAQHDPPFWFTLTPNQLTKELNTIADIAWLDRVMQASNSNLRKAQTELDVTTNRITSLETSLKESEYIETANTELQHLENQHKETETLKAKYEQLTNIAERLESCQRDLKTFRKIVNHFNQYLVPLYDQYTELKNNNDKLTQLIESYPAITEETSAELQTLQQNYRQTIKVKDQLNRLTEILAKTSVNLPASEEIVQLQSEYQQLTDKQEQYNKLTTFLSKPPVDLPASEEIVQLQNHIDNISKKQETCNRLKEILDQLIQKTEEYQEAQSEYQQSEKTLHKQLEGICAICGLSR
jgi:DNA repair exonuclease SbcCD ATPase subunit